MRSIFGLGCGRDTLLELPVPGACAGTGAGAFSQIGAVIILPLGTLPAPWDTAPAFEAAFAQGGRYLPVTGAIPRPVPNRAVLGRVTNGSSVITHRAYALSADVPLGCAGVDTFLAGLQKNWRGWRFWAVTAGGELIGGPTGIQPRYVDAGSAWGGGRDDVKAGYLTIEWTAAGDPATAYVPALTYMGGGGEQPEPPTTMSAVVVQSFLGQVGNVLTVTVNSGALPTPYPARVWVFQNGVKLHQAVGHYTLQPDTSPGQSTVTVNALTHFDGADYQVFLFP